MASLALVFWKRGITLVLLFAWSFLGFGQPAHGAEVKEPDAKTRRAPPSRETWANPFTLRDHFDRHGADFKAKSAEAYAAEAWRFLQRAREEGLPAKVDDNGVIRVYDAKTGAFGAYSREGKTKTFFKPRSRDYFERQPGRLVDLKTFKS